MGLKQSVKTGFTKLLGVGSPTVEPLGRIDKIDEEGLICGWAFTGDYAPAVVSMNYDGSNCGTVVADEFRRDLELAGIGSGHHAFRIPLPCGDEIFDPSLLDIRFQNGKSIEHSNLLRSWAAVDLLTSSVTPHINIEFTSRCNLRCVYCAVSQPDYDGRDLEITNFDHFIEEMKERCVQSVSVNGHGETTFVPGWQERVDALLDAGFGISITTNLARALRPEELGTMARMSYIHVSVDTHNKALLKRLRRKVDLEIILNNMKEIEMKAREFCLPKPQFIWSCVVSNRVALGIVDYVRFGLDCGVRDYVFCNLVEWPTPPGTIEVTNVAALNNEDLARFCTLLKQVEDMIRDAGGSLHIAGDLAEIVNCNAN